VRTTLSSLIVAVHCSRVWQHVAMRCSAFLFLGCCSALQQSVEACCSVLQCVTLPWLLQCVTAECGSMLLCVAVRYRRVWKHVAHVAVLYSRVCQYVGSMLLRVAVPFLPLLQCVTAECGSTLRVLQCVTEKHGSMLLCIYIDIDIYTYRCIYLCACICFCVTVPHLSTGSRSFPAIYIHTYKYIWT